MEGSCMKKAVKIILLVVGLLLLIPVLFFGLLALPWIGICTSIMCAPNPAQPAITEAEFPVSIVYEIDGEEITRENTIICEYDGIRSNEARGKYRWWQKSFKDSDNTSGSAVILYEYDNRDYIAYYITTESAELMGDNDPSSMYAPEHDESFFAYYTYAGKKDETEYNSETGTFEVVGQRDWWDCTRISEEELLERYGIDIISVYVAPPIENTFE